MKHAVTSMICASVLLAATSVAFAGAYGEAAEAEETPAPVAVAAPEPEPEQEGYWYLGAGAVYSIENFDEEADNAWGYHVRGGRRLNDMFALEAQFEHLIEYFDDTDRIDGDGFAEGDIKAWNLTANGKMYPIKGRFQPFVLVGMGVGAADLSRDENAGFIARFGLGLDVLITDNIGIAAEVDYVLPTGNLKEFDQIPISVGVFYNFI